MYGHVLALLFGLGFWDDGDDTTEVPDIDDPVEPSGGSGQRRRRGVAAWGGR